MVNLLQQKKLKIGWLGAIQVQVSSSMFYISAINTLLLAVTFWYTSGYRIQRYAEWVNIWVFLFAAVVMFALVMFIDYKFILPVRQVFINKQSFKHENEAMNLIRKLDEDMQKVKEKMEIE